MTRNQRRTFSWERRERTGNSLSLSLLLIDIDCRFLPNESAKSIFAVATLYFHFSLSRNYWLGSWCCH